MIVLLVLGGLQMTMLGVLGEYLWRALDESRSRPRYNIESFAGSFAHLEARKFDAGKAADEWKFGIAETNRARPQGADRKSQPESARADNPVANLPADDHTELEYDHQAPCLDGGSTLEPEHEIPHVR